MEMEMEHPAALLCACLHLHPNPSTQPLNLAPLLPSSLQAAADRVSVEVRHLRGAPFTHVLLLPGLAPGVAKSRPGLAAHALEVAEQLPSKC